MRLLRHILLLSILAMALGSCAVEEVTSSHNLLGGKIVGIVHGGGGFFTYRNTLPPNNFEVCERSYAAGAPAIEIDVQLSADGHWIVFHDGTLDAATDGSGCIGELAWEEIQGYSYQTRNGPLDGSFPICLLDTILQALVAPYPERELFINVKHDSPCNLSNEEELQRMALSLDSLLSVYAIGKNAFVESMNERFLQLMLASHPECRYIFDDEDFERGLEVVLSNGFDGLAVSNGRISEAQVRKAHAAGSLLVIWGPKVMSDTKKAVGKGPDYIMTDDLLMLQAALRR